MLSPNIWIHAHPGKELSEAIQTLQPTQVFVLVDKNTKRHCYTLIKPMLPPHQLITIAVGEQHKNLQTCQYIWEQLTKRAADRRSLLINLGGGVIGDMGGFCAAAYKRGITFMQLPTTLLAMADAAVGGKVGIDFQHFKNQLGFFYPPIGVGIYTCFLDTLPRAELLSGYAEIVKHSLLDSPALWNTIRRQEIEELQWIKLLEHSVAFKTRITTTDPTEKGLRKILNLGHTVGHALESYFLHCQTPVLHGEAVAAGILIEAYIANEVIGLPNEDLAQIEEYILTNFPILHLDKKAIKPIIKWMHQDKKNASGQIRMALLEAIGKPKFDVAVAENVIVRGIRSYVC
jgi:3-dehydroquinate synthase